MKFGPTPLAEAEGAVLAHGVKLDKLALKKGRVLTAVDIAALRTAGHESVIAARLEADDVPEDVAAAQIAAAVAGDGLTRSAAFTGRCNLFAATRGLAVVDVARLDKLNLLDEAITVATVPPFALVEPRQMVATIKIIPFAVPAAAMTGARAVVAEGGPLVRIAPLKAKRVGLIQTRLAGVKDSVLAKTTATTRARLSDLGSTLAADTIVDHDEASIAAAIAAQRAAGCDPILVMGASAIVDRRDAIPAAIVASGGEVLHFGMPVDPGNLLLLGRIGETPVLGLPGCARSPKLNGFDWVLQRLLADIPVSRADIMRLGAGGLLMEIPTRPLPRGEAGPAPSAPRAPRIAAIVMAAGRSSRMAPANKLLTDVDGRLMVQRAVDAALASQARPVAVVVGHDGVRVREALAGRPVEFLDNPDYAEGLSTSVRAGLAWLDGKNVDGAVFMLGDMPLVTASHIDRLIAAFNPTEGRAICVPAHRGKRGNPVLWGSRFFADMRALEGDKGARTLFREHAEQVCEVEMSDDGVLVDVDTPEALAALRRPARQEFGMTPFDPAAIRAQFPLLMRGLNGGPLHYLDNGATSQLPQAVIDAVVTFETTSRANVLRSVHRLAEAATEAYEGARLDLAHYLNVPGDEIVFTSGTTSAINLVARSFGETLQPGDEIVVSLIEHHGNFVPWQMLRDRRGIVLKILPVTEDGRIDLSALERTVTKRCKLIALTHVSNVTGAVTDVAPVVAAARAVGAKVLLDGAQRTPHGPVDLPALGIDFYAFSGHKMFGPTGIGCLWARKALLESMPPLMGGGEMIRTVTVERTEWADVPHKFEAGTPPIAQAVGLGAAVRWLMALDWAAASAHELRLTQRVLDGLGRLKGARVIGPSGLQGRAPVISFDLAGAHPHDVCQILDGFGVALRGGHHCAQPLMDHFGVAGTTRASLALYNNDGDVDALLKGLDVAATKLR